MSSLVDTPDTSSLLESNCDITPELGTEASTTTTTKSTSVRQRKPSSTVWEHSRKPKDGEPVRERGAKAWYCKYCTDTPYRALSTTTARNHLKAKHDITNDLSLRIIESPSLHALLKAANPVLDKEVISSHTAISSHISSLFLSYKDTVMKMLQSTISKIHLSLGSFSKRLKRISLRMMMNCLVRMSQGSKF